MSENRVSEDLFESTKMSFGDHIEELRVCLVRSLIGIGIAFVLGLTVAPYVVQILANPLEKAISKFKLQQARERIKADQKFLPTETQLLINNNLLPKKILLEPKKLADSIQYVLPDEVAQKQRSIGTFETRWLDLEKLQGLCESLATGEGWLLSPEIKFLSTLITEEQKAQLTTIAANPEPTDQDRLVAGEIINDLLDNDSLLTDPSFKETRTTVAGKEAIDIEFADEQEAREYKNALVSHVLNGYFKADDMGLVEMVIWEKINVKAQSLGAQEPFMIWLKSGLITGLALASPWVFYQVWIFVAAGLFPHERNYVYIYMPFSLGLFVGGALFAFYVVFQFVLDFLFSFNATMGIDPDPRIGEYLGFVMFLPIGFGIAFQLPLVMLFLNRIGVVPVEAFTAKWRIAILVICIVSMVFTPTDPISMVMMAVPLTFLYFGGIGLCNWMPKGRNPFAEAFEP